MSSSADAVTVLAPVGRKSGQRVSTGSVARSRPAIRLLAFGALAVYGALRWSVLLTPAPIGRLVGLLCVGAIAAGALGPVSRRGRLGRASALLGALGLAIAALALAGVPLQLLVHGHMHAIASGIDQGLTALPRVTVPYVGIDTWVRTVVLLGAAILVLDAGFLLAFAPGSLGDARRAGAALPLIALAVVPSTLMRPSAPYLHGLLLFVLVAALLWGERLPPGRIAAASVLATGAGIVGLALAPALDTGHPWVNYESVAGAFSASNLETFDWTQRYGPLLWPRTDRELLDVQASHRDYWKAENLDTFNGIGWTEGAVETGNLLPPPDPSAQARWTQTLRVTVRGMQTTDVIAAGYATSPQHAPATVSVGSSPGTWAAVVDLGPGDTYEVSAYSPRPTASELAAIHVDGSDDLTAGYRSILLPPAAMAPYAQPEVVFPPFHSDLPIQTVSPTLTDQGLTFVSSSPYAGAYELAQRLARNVSTPVEFIQSVQRYLSEGFSYDENPLQRRYPLESFLFGDRRGYCQQFSGAMALLLRMGGIPARVSAGFTSGNYDSTNHQWTVTDLDAHAWVEAWFPHYGWVRFDPTPSAAPALAGGAAAAALAAGARRSPRGAAQAKRRPETGASAPPVRTRSGGGASTLLVLLGVVLIAGLLTVLWFVRPGGRSSVESLIAELERALARCGRPLARATTLAELEHRFRSSASAADYVRALRLARYGAATYTPAPDGRRALRARLAEGLGWSGRLRALWALPPRLR